MLERILVEPQNSWLRRTKSFFAAHGTDLHVSRAAIRAIAERAAEQRTGARALDLVASTALESTVWRLLQTEEDVARIDVTRTTIEAGADARFRLGAQRAAILESDDTLPFVGERNEPEPMRCTAEWYLAEFDRLASELHVEQAGKSAQSWWERIREALIHDPVALHQVAQQLRDREATINEFFTASVFAQTEDLRAVLHYLDYKRIRDAEATQNNLKS